ncbi:MAG: glycosyltransferase family 39 protein, partial [candidate division Zixibacteria bacterium]|nr:glycosyltransferase family 39 protein [candidate division Zixibacteria bacterium]
MSLIDNHERTPKEKHPALKEYISKNRWPLIIAATAALVRIIYLLELSRLPDFVIPMVDEKWHWLWAKEILEGPFFGDGAWFRAPLYPYFLALLAKITGGSILWSKILQALLAGGTAFFTFKLADLLFNRTTAIVAGFIYALYGTLVFYETSFLIPVLFLFFTVWGMYRLVAYSESRTFKSWLLTGVVFGLAIISRPNLLLVIPFLMLWFYYRRDSEQPRSQRLNFLLVLLLGIILSIAPVTMRNYIKTGDFIMISSQGGVNLYLGNNPIADGLNMQMPEVNLDASVTWRQFGTVVTSAAQREAGRELSPAEESSFWTGKAVDFIAENPGGFVKLVWKKCVYLASGFENSDNADIYHQRTKSTLYSLLVWNKLIYFPFGLLLPFALAGIVLARGQSRR